MALLPDSTMPQTLEEALQQSAGSASANLTDQYQQARKRQVGQLAANGQLMGGTSAYSLGDLDTNYQKGLSGIQGNLANAEAGVSSEDWLNQNQFGRSLSLTKDIADRMKPDTLEQVMQGVGAAGQMAAMYAAFA